MSLPGPMDIQHYQGDTLEKGMRINQRLPNSNGGISYSPADLTGWSVSGSIRNARTLTAVGGVTAVKANQSTDPGVVLLQATAAATALWSVGPSQVYDVQLTEDSTGFVRTVAAGRIFVQAQVTT